MKKRGIVLMMTLILISVMMGIVALALTQSERISRLSSSAFNQSTSIRIMNDLEQQLPSLLSTVTGPEQLDLAMRLPLVLQTKKDNFTLKIELSSLYGRLNINRLIDQDGKINENNVALLMRLFAIYPIADTDIFLKLVFDTIDIDTSERGVGTEIAWTQPDFKNGQITDSKQFYTILEHYITLTKDIAILSIPWDRYIGYDGEKMDFNALNPETLSLVLPNVPSEKIRSLTAFRTKAYVTKEEVIAGEPSLSPVFDANFFLYKLGDPYSILCDAHLRENGHEEHFKFQYNLVEKKVQRVEFL